jgi:hypothetical protein
LISSCGTYSTKEKIREKNEESYLSINALRHDDQRDNVQLSLRPGSNLEQFRSGRTTPQGAPRRLNRIKVD